MHHRPPILRRVIASLLLGIASTIAVAWTCAAWPGNDGFVRYSHSVNAPPDFPNDASVNVLELRRTGLWMRSWQVRVVGAQFAPIKAEYRITPQRDGSPRDITMRPFPDGAMAPVWGDWSTWGGRERAAGWPWICCWCETTVGPSTSIRGWTVKCKGGLLVPGSTLVNNNWGGVRVLPFRPVWSGLAANVALYAFAWLTLLMLLPAIRRAVRRRRGQCPSCRYSLAGLPPGAQCPECGQPSP